MKQQKHALALALTDVLNVPADEIAQLIEYPPQPELGDLALPCFRFAKALRKNPQVIAETAAQALASSDDYADVAVAGGYVNIKLKRENVAQNLVSAAESNISSLFSQRRMTGRKAAVDYSSPNIAKPFGVGHLRSTMIGQAIARLLREDGCDVAGINHLGDWGTQFGKNIAAYLRWGDEEVVKRDPVRELLQLYVKFHQEAEKNPELEEEGREWFKKLEDGDAEARRLWQWFIDESLKVFKQTYDLLGVSFDYYLGESFYNDKMDAVVKELKERGLLVESDGAQVVDLSAYNMPPCLIRKSDGTSIYATRDLAAALYRHDVIGADYLIYVVGAEQTLHFSQVFKTLQLMNRDWAQNCRHVGFGLMKYNGEKLSTRKGHVIYLEDVLERAVSEARSIIDEKNPGLEDKERVAQVVGIGAVVFNDLKTYRMHDVDFRYEDVLNFDGETGPYVQYTYARASSVLRKASQQGVDASSQRAFETVNDHEWRLIHQLSQAQEALERAVDDLDPSVMARFVLDVCHAFNRFYHETPILTGPQELRGGRLALTSATRKVIAHAMELLGVEAPEAM